MSNEHLISKNIIQECDDHSGDLLIGIEYFMHLNILLNAAQDRILRPKAALFNRGPRPGPIAAYKTQPKVSTLAAF